MVHTGNASFVRIIHYIRAFSLTGDVQYQDVQCKQIMWNIKEARINQISTTRPLKG